jgi:hypothetical protein
VIEANIADETREAASVLAMPARDTLPHVVPPTELKPERATPTPEAHET